MNLAISLLQEARETCRKLATEGHTSALFRIKQYDEALAQLEEFQETYTKLLSIFEKSTNNPTTEESSYVYDQR